MSKKVFSAKDVAEVVKELCADGAITHVYTVACGGSKAGLFPMYYILRSESKTIHAENITANEFALATPKHVGKNALVVTMSSAGATPETVEAARVAKAAGAKVVTISGKPECTLADNGDYHFVTGHNGATEGGTGIVISMAFELLKVCENYAKYDAAVAALSKVDAIAKKAFEDAAEKAQAWGEKHKNDFFCISMASAGNLDVAYSTSICHLMEMEWINSETIHTGEYFHGPFEITEDHTPMIIVKSTGRTKALDDRAIAFATKFSDNVEVIDLADYGCEELGEVKEFVEPLVASLVSRQYTTTLAKCKKHPFLWRKYMFKDCENYGYKTTLKENAVHVIREEIK